MGLAAGPDPIIPGFGCANKVRLTGLGLEAGLEESGSDSTKSSLTAIRGSTPTRTLDALTANVVVLAPGVKSSAVGDSPFEIARGATERLRRVARLEELLYSGQPCRQSKD